jgi:hypothetical protein
MIAGVQQRQQGRRDCRHPARGYQRGFGVLYRRQFLMQGDMIGGVVEADVTDRVAVGRAAALERSRLEDRHTHGPFDERRWLT